MTGASINIADVRVNGGTQSRTKIDLGVVSDYAEAMREGAAFPPIVVFFDGTEYWLADGFHRYRAYSDAQVYDVPVDIRQGTQRDAILFSVGANAAHGLRRTDADKRQAILVLLADEEWRHWSNREIARQCAVSPVTVARVKEDVAAFHRGEARDDGGKYRPGREVVFNSHEVMKIPTVHVDSERTYTTKHGSTATMQTANIGASSKADHVPETPESQDSGPIESPGPEKPADAPNDDQNALGTTQRPAPSGLTLEALEEDNAALREEVATLKAKLEKSEAESKRLRALLADLQAEDSHTVIRRLNGEIEHLKSKVFRESQAADRERNKAYKLKKRVEELEAMPIDMGAAV